MRTSYELGRKGEAEAAAFLAQKNYRYRKAEVDLIVQKGNTLVAVEIKTRSTAFFWQSCAFFKTQTATTYC